MYNLEKRVLMETYRIQTTVSKDGKLSITGLPFRPGEKVEVTVRGQGQKSASERQALANELKTLFKEFQSLPQAQTITEEEIAAEIAAYRAAKTE
jgi:hypothetical protein